MSLWVVRAGRYGEQQETALNEGVVCHAWNELPDFSRCETLEELKRLYETLIPEEKGMKQAIGLGQVWRFAREIKVWAFVALPLKTESSIAIGNVSGPYEYKDLANEAAGDNCQWRISTEKEHTVVKYSDFKGSKRLFASRYKLYLPSEKQLCAEIERERELIVREQEARYASADGGLGIVSREFTEFENLHGGMH